MAMASPTAEAAKCMVCIGHVYFCERVFTCTLFLMGCNSFMDIHAYLCNGFVQSRVSYPDLFFNIHVQKPELNSWI